jgi:hypothetical protein
MCACGERAAVLSPGVLLFEAVQLDLLVDFAHQAHLDGVMGCLTVRVRVVAVSGILNGRVRFIAQKYMCGYRRQ